MADPNEDLGDILRDPFFEQHMQNKYVVDPPAAEVYPGDEAVLQSLGYNEFNISPNLDYKQRQGLSDQLRKAWFSRTKEGLETKPQYQFQSPMGRIMTATGSRRASPAETELSFDINKYLDDPDKLARESGMRTVPVEDYSFARDTVSDLPSFFGKDPERDQTKYKFASAPEGAQDAIYDLPYSPDWPRAAEKALRESEEFKDVDFNYKWGLKMEPHNKKPMYRDPRFGGQYTYVFEPGLDAYDIKKEAPLIGTMTATALAAAVLAKNPVAVPAVVDTVVYSTWRIAELKKARKNDFLKTTRIDPVTNKEVLEDWTNGEIRLQAAKESAFVFGISMLTPLVINNMARLGKTVDPTNPAFQKVGGLPLDKDQLVASRNYLKEIFRAASEKEGSERAMEILSVMSGPEMNAYAKKLGMTGKYANRKIINQDVVRDDVLAKTGEVEGGAVQRQMLEFAENETGPEADLLRKVLGKKQQLFDDLRQRRLSDEEFENLLELVVLTEGDEATIGGIKILGATEAVKRPAIEAAETTLETTQANLQRIGSDMAEGGVPAQTIARPARTRLHKLRDLEFKKTNKEYKDFFSQTGAIKIDIDPLVNYASNRIKGFKKSVFAGTKYKEGGGGLLQELGATRKLKKPIKKDDGIVREYKLSTFNQFSDDLQTVRRLKRQAGDQKNYELEFELRNLENEMKGLRTDALLNAAREMPKGGPRTDLIKKIKKLETTYAQNIAKFEKGFIGTLLKRTEGSRRGMFGEYKLGDVEFLNKVLNKNIGDDEIEPLLKLISGPENLDIQLMFADAIKGQYKAKMQGGVLDGPLKPLTAAQHTAFKNKYEPAMRRFLTKDQQKIYNNAANAAEKIKESVISQKNIIRSLNDTPWGKSLLKEDVGAEPQRIFNKMWKSGGEDDMFNANKELYKILHSPGAGKQGIDATKAFKARIMRDMEDATHIFSTKDTGLTSSRALDDYLEEYGPLLKIWYGEPFLNSMKTLQKMARFFETLPATGPRAGERSFYQGVLSNLARVIVGMFTREGRALTAVQVVGSKFATKRIFSDLIEGDKLATRLEATKWMSDPKVLESIRRGLVLGELYTGQPNIIGEAVPKANLPAGELDIETAPVIPPVLRGLTTYDKYESYNIGGRVKRSKLMPLRYDL